MIKMYLEYVNRLPDDQFIMLFNDYYYYYLLGGIYFINLGK